MLFSVPGSPAVAGAAPALLAHPAPNGNFAMLSDQAPSSEPNSVQSTITSSRSGSPRSLNNASAHAGAYVKIALHTHYKRVSGSDFPDPERMAARICTPC